MGFQSVETAVAEEAPAVADRDPMNELDDVPEENQTKSNITRRKKNITLLALGRQSRMEKTSLAFPSGSSGRKTPIASTNI